MKTVAQSREPVEISSDTAETPTELSIDDRERWDAFLSYRRIDGGLQAAWLRRRLQRFRMPAPLARYNRRLRIFQDTSYERAGDFYTMMFVLISPTVHKASGVAKEITMTINRDVPFSVCTSTEQMRRRRFPRACDEIGSRVGLECYCKRRRHDDGRGWARVRVHENAILRLSQRTHIQATEYQ